MIDGKRESGMPEIEGLKLGRDLDDQRDKRPGSRDRIDRIKDEMDRDVLRTKIAKVICGMDALHAEQWSLDVADAVIAELGMRQEWQAMKPGLVIPMPIRDSRDHAERDCIPGDFMRSRYLTDWKTTNDR